MTAQAFWLLTIFNCIIFPFTVFNLLILNTNLVKSISPFLIISGSMDPTVPQGSLVYSLRKTQYGIGDIVTFAKNNENITHRIDKIIKISGETYFSTRGDANIYPDFDLVNQKSVLGKVVVILPFLGQLIHLYENSLLLIAGIIVPIFLFWFSSSNKIMPLELKRL